MDLTLYLATILIWGSTWLAIQYQLGDVSPAWSVTYRFFLAGILLLIYCYGRGLNLKFSRREHGAMVMQGIFLFSGNYLLYYFGSEYLISGVVAVTFALILAMNIVNARIFFGTPITLKIVIGTFLGLLGLTEIFWSQIQALSNSAQETHAMLVGLGYCILATLIASWGNMIAKRNQMYQLPILQSNGLSMCYGATFSGIVALWLGDPMIFNWSPSYIISFLYLSLIGSIVAFGCYLKLLGRIGPERAAYAFVILPVVAMLLSNFFEDFQWQQNTIMGIILIAVGNVLVLKNNKK